MVHSVVTRSVERGICPIAELYVLHLTLSLANMFTVVAGPPQQPPSLRHHHLGHVTTSSVVGFTVYSVFFTFLWLVNLNQPSTLHGCRDMKPQKCVSHEFDLLGSSLSLSRLLLKYYVSNI